MNKEIKAKWLAALRSGKYKQAVGALHTDDNAFCCLGVLCDLHAQETGAVWDGEYRYFKRADIPPTLVCDWAGLEEANPIIHRIDLPIDTNEAALSVAEYNDRKYSFDQIADLIEQHL
jgi:hypothetical protein